MRQDSGKEAQMGNQYFVSREDGETYGPFENSDSALVWIVDDFADPDGLTNGVLERYQREADQLHSWFRSMAERRVTHSASEYGAWLRAAKEFAAEVEFLVFGIEFVVDPSSVLSPIRGITHLIEPGLVHSIDNKDDADEEPQRAVFEGLGDTWVPDPDKRA